MNPRIAPAAQRLAMIYDQDAGDVAQMLRLNLAERLNQSPDLNDRPDQYILNRAAWDARNTFQARPFTLEPLDDDLVADESDVEWDEQLDRQAQIVAVRELVEGLDGELRAIAETIMNQDLEVTSSRDLAGALSDEFRPAGTSDAAWTRSVRRCVERLRVELEPAQHPDQVRDILDELKDGEGAAFLSDNEIEELMRCASQAQTVRQVRAALGKVMMKHSILHTIQHSPANLDRFF